MVVVGHPVLFFSVFTIYRGSFWKDSEPKSEKIKP